MVPHLVQGGGAGLQRCQLGRRLPHQRLQRTLRPGLGGGAQQAAKAGAGLLEGGSHLWRLRHHLGRVQRRQQPQPPGLAGGEQLEYVLQAGRRAAWPSAPNIIMLARPGA